MAGLLTGGMGTIGTAGFGSGFMRGMDKSRQHRREDEADAQRQQTHGLQMRRGEQQYSQSDELFPEQLKGAQQGNQIRALNINDGERKDEIAGLDHDALMQLWQGTQAAGDAMRNGNPMAANENNAQIMEQLGTPTTIWSPTPDGKIGRYDPQNMDEPLDVFNNLSEASDAYINNSRELFKQLSPSAFKKELEREPKERTESWSPMGSSGYALEQRTGRSKKVFDAEKGGRGGSGGGSGLKGTDENTLNRWIEGYFGKRDLTGQFVLTNEQKYQAVQAQEKAVAMLNIDPSLSMSKAYQIAASSVGGSLPVEKARELAAEEAIDSGIPKTVKQGVLSRDVENPEYRQFIEQRADELMSISQQEAQRQYESIVGSRGAQQQGLPRQRQQQAMQGQQQTRTVLTMPNGRAVTEQEILAEARNRNMTPQQIVEILIQNGGE